MFHACDSFIYGRTKKMLEEWLFVAKNTKTAMSINCRQMNKKDTCIGSYYNRNRRKLFEILLLSFLNHLWNGKLRFSSTAWPLKVIFCGSWGMVNEVWIVQIAYLSLHLSWPFNKMGLKVGRAYICWSPSSIDKEYNLCKGQRIYNSGSPEQILWICDACHNH